MQNKENGVVSVKRKAIKIITPNKDIKKKCMKENCEDKADSLKSMANIISTLSTDKLDTDIAVVCIKDESFEVIKSKLIRNNNIFNRLIASSSKEKPIRLSDDITAIGFKYFYLYLQKENFTITGEDTVDLLITAIKFHEKDYINENKEKFQKSIDDDIVIRLLEIIPSIDEKYVRETLKDIVSPYFQTNMSIFFDPSIKYYYIFFIVISNHLSLKFLLFLYDIQNLHISSEEILVDLLFNTYKRQIKNIPSFIDKISCIYLIIYILDEKVLEKDLNNVACKIYWNKIKSISIENAILLSNLKSIYIKSQKLTISRVYMKIYFKNGKEIETKLHEEQEQREREEKRIKSQSEIDNNNNNNVIIPSSTTITSTSDSSDSSSSEESDNEESNNHNILSINNNNKLELLINKYLSMDNNIFHIDNRDIPQINSLFDGKNYPLIDLKKPIKNILIMLFFYIQTKKNYIVDEESNSLKSYDVIEYIITKHKTDPKSFYSNSWPICLIPFLPSYCTYIYTKCGMKLLSELYLLYHIINKDKNNLNYYIRDCINDSNDYKIFSIIVNNPKIVESVCIFIYIFIDPSLLQYQNKLYEEYYIISLNSNVTISPTDTKTKCKFSIIPETSYCCTFTKNGIIKCYSDRETESHFFKVTCQNVINTITSCFCIQYKNITWDTNYLSPNIEIDTSKKGLKVKRQTNKFQHCFLNIPLCNGKYHLVIKNYTLSTIVFGVTTKCDFAGEDLCRDDDSIGVSMDKKGIQGEEYGKNIRRMRKVGKRNYNIEFNMCQAGDTQSFMKIYTDSSQPLIIKGLKSPCCFFVDLLEVDSYLTLESVLVSRRVNN